MTWEEEAANRLADRLIEIGASPWLEVRETSESFGVDIVGGPPGTASINVDFIPDFLATVELVGTTSWMHDFDARRADTRASTEDRLFAWFRSVLEGALIERTYRRGRFFVWAEMLINNERVMIGGWPILGRLATSCEEATFGPYER